MPNRWSADGADGSAFHEIIVLPTVAPELARPQNLVPYLGQQVSESGSNGAATVPSVEDDQVTLPPDREFFVSAVLSFTVPASGPRARPKKDSETKNGPAVLLLKLTRCEFLRVILQLHDLHQAYQPSDVSGFPFKMSWAGSPGGKTNAPTIRDNAEYATVIDQLRSTRRTMTAILVAIDMDQMEPYRVRVSSAIDPRVANWSGESSFGTQVPRSDRYSSEAQLHGSVIMDIREEWKCEEHDDFCYQKDGQHFPLNRWKLKAWAAAVAAGKTTPREPPVDLFRDDDARRMVTTKQRGRTGPNSRSNDHIHDNTAQLLSAVIPLVTALTQRHNETHSPVTPTHKRARDESLTPVEHANCRTRVALPLSPAPAVEDELRLCLDEFGRAKSVDADAIDAAFNGLNVKGYTPDTLEVISVDRVAELTGLTEGKAAALMKFARRWSAKMEQKRARDIYSN
ncbi:hypothetical protein BGY98DRAFT_75869 [Russula aff. rugulosa BPL654]|nr:hypothetical protein BGY98DRAFT_75869 [Russula aff. rugulosa BPL654]